MSLKLQLPALAIFDMDGLIFDTERLFMTTKDGVMKEYGYTQQKRRLHPYHRNLRSTITGYSAQTLRGRLPGRRDQSEMPYTGH